MYMNNGKCIEYYFDSKTFTKEELQENIEKAKQEFPNKNLETEMFLNQWGVYVLKINFTDKIEYISNLKEKHKDRKVMLIREKNLKTSKKRTAFLNRQYGQYKKTGEYNPL